MTPTLWVLTKAFKGQYDAVPGNLTSIPGTQMVEVVV